MEELNLKELYEFIKSKIGLLIIITTGICLVGCLYGLFIQTPMYSSDTTIILGGNEGETTETITQNDVTLNKNLVNTYAQIVKSRRVLNQVIDALKLDISYNTLNTKISVTAVNNTEIIKITVTDEDPIRAKNIANVTAEFFKQEVVELYNMNNVEILDEAIDATTPYNINVIKQITLYFMLGLIVGAIILFMIFYFDRSIKSAEQVEQKLKLPILGSVQEFNKGGKK